MANLCIIPARGGSKRIPDKNIKKFLGKPIIAYSIEVALNSKLFDEVMVSTDSRRIAKIAEKYGAKVPFMRSKRNSSDRAGLFDVFEEVIEKYKEKGKFFQYVCLILATSPFVEEKMLRKALLHLKKNRFDLVLPIVEFDYPIWRALKIKKGKVKMIWPANLKKRSQDLPVVFHDAGLFYWIDCKKVLKKKSLFTDNTGYILVDRRFVQDIDTKKDWQIAEMKYKIKCGLEAK